tara:strand:+ start:599 stop:778 length:180 start_codon:yes stop_codon:yes gene_type:complete
MQYGLFEIMDSLKAGDSDEQIAAQMKRHPDAYGKRKGERLEMAMQYRRALSHTTEKERD